MSQPCESGETLVLHAEERRGAIRSLIDSARRELRLSIFRCEDFTVLDGLAEAVGRGVQVRALLTPHAKNWRRRLEDLEFFLENMGVTVRRYQGSGAKYHCKYIVADDGPAMVASLNFTRKCFEQTCDFVLLTPDPEISASLSLLFEEDWEARSGGARLADSKLADRLILGPQYARARLAALLEGAQRSIRIIDHRLSDPHMFEILRQREGAGVSVQVLGAGMLEGVLSHGRMILVDEAAAVIGSIALSEASLNLRREVAVEIRDGGSLRRLAELFDSFAVKAPEGALALAKFTGGDEEIHH